MGKHPLKNKIAVLGLLTALAAMSAVGAHAFTETKVPDHINKTAPKSAPALQLDKSSEGAGLSLTTRGSKSSDGTELSIPGVGSIGKLPKLDFGLELLYGSGSTPGAETAKENQKEDVLIKGKIRHRF